MPELARSRTSEVAEGVAQALGVKAGERRRSALLFLYLFLASAVFILGRTVRDTLFLSRYSLAALPWMFVLYGVVSAIVAVAYGRFADRLPRHVGTAGTVALGGATYLLTWGLVRLGIAWIYPVFYVWSEVVANLLIVQFWTLANDLHDARAAKRLFPIIGSARVLGVVVVGTSTGAIVRRLGTPQLLFVLVAMMIVLAGIARALRREPRVSAPTTTRGPAPKVFGSPYVRALAALVLLTFMSLTVGDYQFKAIARATYREDALAQFFALFYAATGVVSFLFQVFVTPRILGRFGVGYGMALMPVVFGAASAILVGVPVLPVATVMKFADNGLQYTIHETSLQALYVPFPARVKARTRALLDVAVKPLAYGAGGLLLVALSSRLAVRELSIVTSVIVVVWLGLVPVVRRLYQRTLAHTLSALGPMAIEEEPYIDSAGRAALAGMLESPDARLVLLALEHLGGDPRAARPEVVPKLLEHSDPRVRAAALRVLPADSPVPEATLEARLHDPSAEVRAACARRLSRTQGDEAVEALRGLLDDPDDDVRTAACAGLMRSCGVEGSLVGAARLGALLEGTPEARVEAAQLLGEVGRDAYIPLRRLLDDSDDGVRRAALKASAGVGDLRLVPKLLGLLDDPTVRVRAGQALVAVGEPSVPALLARLSAPGVPRETKLFVPRLLRSIASPSTYDGLLSHLGSDDSHVRLRILAALVKLREATGRPPETLSFVRKAVEHEAASELRTLLAWETARSTFTAPLLVESLAHRARRAERRIVLMLALRYDTAALRLVRDRLADPRRRANALETLDSLLEPSARALVMPFFDDAPLPVRIAKASLLVPEVPTPDALLREECRHPNPFVVAVALDALTLAKSPIAEEVAPEALAHPSPLVREAAIHAIVFTSFSRVRELVTPLVGDADPTVVAHAREALLATPDDRPEDRMNTTLEKIFFLKSTSLFGHVESEDLAPLARVATIETFAKGQKIVSEGEIGDRLYVIVSGKVTVSRKGERVAELGPGEAVGEMAILDASPRSASATAEEETSALCIGSEEFYEILHEQVEIAEGVIRMLTQRLRSTLEGGANGA